MKYTKTANQTQQTKTQTNCLWKKSEHVENVKTHQATNHKQYKN